MSIIELKEYQTLPPRKGKSLTEKEIEIIKKLENLTLEEADYTLRQKLHDKDILSITTDPIKKGLQLSAQSHIGVAQFSQFAVAITPKFSNIENLIKLIDYVYDLDLEIFPESETEFEGEKNLLSEIIISTFVKHCQNLLRKGLVKSYTLHEDDLSFLRGKLLVSQQIVNDSKSKLQFACEHDEFEYNNIENQILLFCLERCYYITINEERKKKIKRIIQTFEGLVEHKPITLDDFKIINYNQMNHHYKKTHEICKLIVSSIAITDFYEQKTRFVNSFFVNMNDVFEKFVFKLFHEFYPLPCKEQQHYKSWVSESGNKSFDIITDILIFDKKRQNIYSIIDTKYKEELSESDRYQISFYIRDYDMKEGYAILPKTENSKSDTLNVPRQDISIKIRTIEVDEILNLIYSKTANKKQVIKEKLLGIIPLEN